MGFSYQPAHLTISHYSPLFTTHYSPLATHPPMHHFSEKTCLMRRGKRSKSALKAGREHLPERISNVCTMMLYVLVEL